MTQEELTAYHEAAHAVACYELRVPFKRISIIAHGYIAGSVAGGKPPEWLEWDSASTRARLRVERQIICYYAGQVVSESFGLSTEGQPDFAGAASYAFLVAGSGREADAFVTWLWERARNLVTSPLQWMAIEALAATLMVDKEMSARKARRIIAQAYGDALRTPEGQARHKKLVEQHYREMEAENQARLGR